MRSIIILCWSILMLLALPVAYGEEAAMNRTDEPLVTKLSNGMNVLIKKDTRFPLVSLRLFVHTGSTGEDPHEAGISHLLEHMVFKGTEHRPKGTIAADIEKTGGYVNAATSFDYTVYLTDMMSANWQTGLDVLRDMVFFPYIDPVELASEKEVVLAELQRGEDTPQNRLFKLAQARGLRGTAYARPIIGTVQTIKGITKEAIHSYINKHYLPQSMLLLVCGNVDEKEVLLHVEKYFGSLLPEAPQQAAVSPVSGAAQPDTTIAVEAGPWKKVFLAVTIPVPGQDDPRSAKLDVLAHLLGGDATSYLYQTYKYDKRLVDSISVGNYTFEKQGMLYITVTLDADKLQPFWTAFTSDLGKIGSLPITQAALDRAKINIETQLFSAQETLSGYASKLGYFTFFGDSAYTEAHYLAAVKDTSAEEISTLLSEYIRPELASVVCLAPEEAMQLPEGRELASFLQHSWTEKFIGSSKKESWDSVSKLRTWAHYSLLSAAEETATVSHDSKVAAAETIPLGNGRTLILQHDPTLPFVAVNLMYQGGNMLLEPEHEGLGAFTASMLEKGTKKYSAMAFEEFQADRAASFTAAAGQQSFSLQMHFLSRFSPDMLGLLQDVVREPAFLTEEAARVKEQQVASIVMQEDQPVRLAFRRIFPMLFPEHSYGYRSLGDSTLVKDFTAEMAAAFWEKQRTMPWVLSVSGAFDREAVIAAAKEIVGPERPAFVLKAPVWGTTKEMTVHLPGREQAHLFMIFPTAGIGAADEAKLDLLQNILAGQSGLLFRDLRDKEGLGYTVTALPWKAQKAGMLVFYIGTSPDKLTQAKAGFERIVRQLHTALLSQDDMQRGKNQMQGDYYRDHQSLASRSAEAAILYTLGLPLDADRAVVQKAQDITAKELQDLARKYLVLDAAYTVVVLPEENTSSAVK